MIVSPVVALGQTGDRDAEDRVQQSEVEAAQQAQLRIGELQVNLDGLTDGGDDRPVDEIEGVGGEQQPQHRGLVTVRVKRPIAAGRTRVGHTESLPSNICSNCLKGL